MGGLRRFRVRFGHSGLGLAMGLALVVQSCGKADGSGSTATGGASDATGGAHQASGGANDTPVGASGGRAGSGGASSTGGTVTTAGEGGETTAGEGGETTAGEGGETTTGAGGDSDTSLGGSGSAGSSAGGAGSGGRLTIPTGGGAGVGACVAVATAMTPVPTVLEFLVDTSASMREREQASAPTKWEVTSAALVQTFKEMAEGTEVGLIFYPNVQNVASAGMCIVREEAVPIAALNAQHRQALIEAVQAKVPSGATPTHDAMKYAFERLGSVDATLGKFLVLITDGAPTYALNCVGNGMTPADSAPLIQETANASAVGGVRTFVIGAPGSEAARTTLSQMATQGGTASPGCSDQGPEYCHFDMTSAPDFSAGLNRALEAVGGAVKSCRYTFSAPAPIDAGKVNVAIIDGTGRALDVWRDTDGAGACEHGWQYATPPTEIVLCPDACERVQADPGARVEARLGCQTLIQ